MKNLEILSILLLVLFITSCEQDEPSAPNINDKQSGKIFLRVDKENAPESVVWIEALLTRAGYDTVSGLLNLLSDSTADLLLEDIQAGEWHLRVDAKDSAGIILYTGETDVQVFAGFTTQVNLVLEPTGAGVGNIYIWVTWGTHSTINKAIDFDGNGDYANTLNSPYLPTVNGTAEAWVKVRTIIPPPNTQDIGEAFISKNEEQWNQGDYYAFFEYASGRLKSRVQAPPSYEIDLASNQNFWQSLDEWVHFAFTWGAGGLKMYIDGALQSIQSNSQFSALNNTYNLYVGCNGYMLHNGNYTVSDYLDGQMDELRIWNYQKSTNQILSLMNSTLSSNYYSTLDSGLVGYWRFDRLENLGINNDGTDDVRDYSVLQNHFDLHGNAHLVPVNR